MAGPPVLGLLGYGLLFGSQWWRLAHEDCRVTPLMFHGVRKELASPERYTILESEFAREMDQLKAAGATTPPIKDVLAALGPGARSGCPFPPRSVIITFDMDGKSFHVRRALPHLMQNGFTALFFVPTMAIGQLGGVEESDLQILAGAGMTIGSHSEHHYDMRAEQPDSMIESLRRTRVTLHGISGQPIDLMSAPGGRYNGSVIAGVATAGFGAFFTSDPCYVSLADSPRRLCRIEIRGDGGMTALEAVTKPRLVAIEAANWWTKRAVEAVVGWRIWWFLHRMRTDWERDPTKASRPVPPV